STDFRHPAISLRQENGSKITDFTYHNHKITSGKPSLENLPATYVEDENESKTLTVTLKDSLTGVEVELLILFLASCLSLLEAFALLIKETKRKRLNKLQVYH